MGDELCEGLRVGHCIGGEENTLGQGRRGEGLSLSRGGMVNAKFEAHIIWSTVQFLRFGTLGNYKCV